MTLFFFDKQVLEKSVPILRDAVLIVEHPSNYYY